MTCNGQQAKPSRVLKVGDAVRVKNEAGEYAIEVLELSEMRGSATVAQTLYSESDESKGLRAKVAEERRTLILQDRFAPGGRPSKKDRRMIHSFSGKR